MIALALLLLHGGSVSSSRIDVSGREARVTFTFSMEDLSELARLDLDRSGVVEPREWVQVLPAIFAYLGSRYRIDGCTGEGDPAAVPPAISARELRAPVTLRMRYLSPVPLDRVTVRCELFREHEGNPRHLAELPGGRTIVFDRDRRGAEAPIAPAGFPYPWAAAALAAVASGGLVALLQRRQLDPLGLGGHGQEGVAHALHDPLLPGDPG